MQTAILVSGGLDSSVLFAELQTQGVPVVGVHVIYNHPARNHQLCVVRWLTSLDYRIITTVADILGPPDSEVPARNTLFCALVKNRWPEVAAIYLGCCAEDQPLYYDCTPRWASCLTDALGTPILLPYASVSKQEIARRGEAYGLRTDALWSCHVPRNGAPCGVCRACKLRTQDNINR